MTEAQYYFSILVAYVAPASWDVKNIHLSRTEKQKLTTKLHCFIILTDCVLDEMKQCRKQVMEQFTLINNKSINTQFLNPNRIHFAI